MADSKDIWNNFWEEVEETNEKKSGTFWTQPVKAEVFFRDWVGMPLFPRQLKAVDAAFNEEYTSLSDNFNELLLSWGKGSGKDVTIANLLCYIVYFLLCMNDPQETLGIKSGEPIDIVNVAFDGDQANSVFFEKFVRAVENTLDPVTGKNFFVEQGMNIEKSILKKNIQFPKNIRAWSQNSREYKSEGKNILLAVCDEIAQFRFDHAKKIRKHLRTSAKTRFPNNFKIFYISFLTSANDFMAYLLDQAESGELSGVYVDRAATWEVRSKKNCPEELLKYTVDEDVFQDDYDEDPVNSMLMYECKIPKYRGDNFIKKAEKITDCCNMDRESPVIFPDTEKGELDRFWTQNILAEELEPFFKPFTTYEIFKLEKEYEKNPSESLENKIRVEKERHGSGQYYVHIDLSRGVVDCAGICMGHTYTVLDKQKIYIDLMLQIRPPEKEGSEASEIDLNDILKFVIQTLYKKLKFPIVKITADGWNSKLFLNICEQEGIEADTISLEKNTGPYDTLKDYLYAENITYYMYPPLIRELTELIVDDKKKINHPRQSKWRMREEGLPKGSKDIADCVCGVVASICDTGGGEPLAFGAK